MVDLTFLFPQMDHEQNKKTQQAICDSQLSEHEWGFVSEQQVKAMLLYKA